MNTNQVNQAFEKWFGETYKDLQFNRTGMIEAWQAATKASESEINSLKQRVEELQADNTIMRDTLNKIALGHVYDADIIESAGDCLQRLCTTQSLAELAHEVIDRCKTIVADDALAITFQSMGAYRSAIIKAINGLKV